MRTYHTKIRIYKMIDLIKRVLAILFGTIISFGSWYLVGWFLSNEPNPLLWDTVGKIIYLLFGFLSFSGMIDELDK